ncbi:MAG: universal stress protein [Desulfamplus sp.]|nr:universal stress protein [Desulfamplus sp.]
MTENNSNQIHNNLTAQSSNQNDDKSNTILVALDGSERSMKTVEYLYDFKPFHNKKIVLYHVFSDVPESYWDMGRTPFSRNGAEEVKGWGLQRRITMDEFMERARNILITAGYKPQDITVSIKERQKGIARDIITEAQKGYFALLIRRRGYGALLHMIMGSTTTKIVEKLSGTPVLLAGLNKIRNSILIGIDGSEGSEQAVDFTAKAVAQKGCKIVLCTVLRDFDIYAGDRNKKDASECVDCVFEDVESAMRRASQILQKSGVKSADIERKIITGVGTRAGAIAKTAEEERCDTIVVGRRGLSNVNDFNIGRVSWKIIHAAREMTVWIV